MLSYCSSLNVRNCYIFILEIIGPTRMALIEFKNIYFFELLRIEKKIGFKSIW